MKLEAVTEVELRRPVAIGAAKVTDEPHNHVVQSGVGERLQERPRIALPEKRTGMRDAEPLAAAVFQSGEVVEVRPVQDRNDHTLRLERARLSGDRIRRGDDCIRLAGDEPCHLLTDLLLGTHDRPFGTTVRMGADRIAQIRNPARAGRSLHGRADQMNGVRR